MHKVMVFIDYQNFFISWKWKNRGRKPPFVDYQKLGRLINRQIPVNILPLIEEGASCLTG